MSALAPLVYTTVALLQESSSEWQIVKNVSYTTFYHPAGATLTVEAGSGAIIACNNFYPGPIERFFLRRAMGVCLARMIRTKHADLLLEAAERE